jgi:hypothetical protein
VSGGRSGQLGRSWYRGHDGERGASLTVVVENEWEEICWEGIA